MGIKNKNLFIAKLLILGLLVVAVVSVAQASQVTVYPGQGSDDGYANSAGSFDNSAASLYVGYSGGSRINYYGWVRFPGVNIPQGSTIGSAYLYFYSGSCTDSISTVNKYIYGIDEDNHTAPTNYSTWSTDHSSYHTSASVTWDSVPCPNGWKTSPDIKTVIQEIVDRASWSSGNAMGIHVDTGSSATYHQWMTYENTNDPYLQINYTEPITAGVTVTETGGSTAVTEGGATDTYSVVLDGAPEANVIITPSVSGSDATTTPASRTFTTANWATPQSFTVTAVDDAVDETSPENNTINHSASSGDTNYNGISIDSVTVAVTDNDTANVSVTTSTTAVTEGGATTTFSVVLTSQPTNDVTITPAATGYVSLSPSTLTFTTVTDASYDAGTGSGGWNVPHIVTVTAINDDVDRDTEVPDVTQSASSGDSNYNSFSIPTIPITVTDNDTAAVIISAD